MEMTVGDLRKLIAGKPNDAVVPVHVKYGEVEIDTIFLRIDDVKARRRPFGIHMECSLVGEPPLTAVEKHQRDQSADGG